MYLYHGWLSVSCHWIFGRAIHRGWLGGRCMWRLCWYIAAKGWSGILISWEVYWNAIYGHRLSGYMGIQCCKEILPLYGRAALVAMKALINTCTVSWLRQTGTWRILSMRTLAQSAFKSFYSYSTCVHTPNLSPLSPQLLFRRSTYVVSGRQES